MPLPAIPAVRLSASRGQTSLEVDLAPVAAEIRRWKSVDEATIWAMLSIVRQNAEVALASEPRQPFSANVLGARVIITLDDTAKV